ncbi:hypothetical protein ACOME3_010116 [Neoechinorhynchus agilis]
MIKVSELARTSQMYEELGKCSVRCEQIECRLMSVLKVRLLEKTQTSKNVRIKKRKKSDSVQLNSSEQATKKTKLKTKQNVLKTLQKAMKMAEDSKAEDRWQLTMEKASGSKLVADDPVALKRLLKNKADKKKRSAKKWKERTTTVIEAQEERKRKKDENRRKRKKSTKKGGKKVRMT